MCLVSIDDPGGTVTEIRESYYSVDLPGEWGTLDSDDPAVNVYREEEGKEQVTVTLLGVAPSSAEEEPFQLLDSYLRHRVNAEMAETPALELTDPEVEIQQDAFVASFGGFDPGQNRRTQHFVIFDPPMLVDVHYQALEMEEEEFARRADEILSTVGIAKP
jgi:hypothetical protein